MIKHPGHNAERNSNHGGFVPGRQYLAITQEPDVSECVYIHILREHPGKKAKYEIAMFSDFDILSDPLGLLNPWKTDWHDKVIPRYYRNGDEETAIVCLELPTPSQVTECRRIYLCFNKATNDLMYFTSELSAQGTFYLCAWTKQHCHMMLNPGPDISEFDNVAQLFRELAGFDPTAMIAM